MKWIRDILDRETAAVGTATIASLGITWTTIEHTLQIAVLLGSAIFVWRKALSKKLPKD